MEDKITIAFTQAEINNLYLTVNYDIDMCEGEHKKTMQSILDKLEPHAKIER